MDERMVAEILGVSKAVDTDWFAADIDRIDGSSFKPVYHIIDVSLPTSAVLNVIRSGDQTLTEALNAGVALAAGSAYRFSIKLNPGDSYNLQYTGIAGPQLVTCRIAESQNP